MLLPIHIRGLIIALILIKVLLSIFFTFFFLLILPCHFSPKLFHFVLNKCNDLINRSINRLSYFMNHFSDLISDATQIQLLSNKVKYQRNSFRQCLFNEAGGSCYSTT